LLTGQSAFWQALPQYALLLQPAQALASLELQIAQLNLGVGVAEDDPGTAVPSTSCAVDDSGLLDIVKDLL
jgi:hypothetical protein